MLLRHTTADVKERKALTVNPAKTCQPIGAMYAALGINKCMPHSHGSQGCCSYHRSTLSRHYKDPVIATTSSFTEGASVFGGQANLVTAITNIFNIYNPRVIAVHTTCLSETIGDDVKQIISKAKEEGKVPKGKVVFEASTPSYTGSHVTGFANMVKSMALYFSENTGNKTKTINIIPGWVEPSDMREIKCLAHKMAVETIVFPDTSDVLDSPLTGKYKMYPDGGVTIEQLIKTGDSLCTLSLGAYASLPAARALDAKCKVPLKDLDIPIGLRATDRFIHTLSTVSSKSVPKDISRERGRVLDMMSDYEQYFHNKRVALFGDPDTLIPLTEFLCDLGMKPVYIVTGTPGKYFEDRMTELLKNIPEAKFKQGATADMFLIHQWIKQEPVDILIGNTYGKYIAKDESIPLIRIGFPILDRVGHSYFPIVGYKGCLRLLEKITETILDHKDKVSSDEKFELVL